MGFIIPNETEQGKVQAKIRLITSESNSEQIQLIIPQSQYEKFQEYKNINESDVVIDQEFCAGFTLSDKQLYVTGHFEQQGIMLGAENEEMGADLVSLQSQTVPIPINSVITQDNKQLDNVFEWQKSWALTTETQKLKS
ncbi:hypothetical protein GO685_03805 [Wolbachia endosymbiont of Madathamugadia hiepei]|uniref:hypothetical protein n=1 Tax=Wolbachia endosymbiont of Madathamugadia hiepei TaxID=1241303 RepID=UPI00158B3F70|nr:hypothetical protein [Wolbachia endosymbiont of Madathamugadia hiepei]NUX01601.1 hypothetical protein [Wolbachia endosymbiont of Madathamugadia hiepei]